MRNDFNSVLETFVREPTEENLVDRYTFGLNDEYEIRVAASVEDRKKAWALVHDVYVEQGYARPEAGGLWYGPHDALPDTTTLIGEHDGEIVAALTLVFDSSLGLPGDTLYAEEIALLRENGRYPCELVSLVNKERHRAANVMIVKHMFKLAYITAMHLEKATDFIITVNPHHVSCYTRALLFEELAGEKTYEKVAGAPAVLLRLDLLKSVETYRKRYDGLPGKRNLYRFFKEGIPALSGWLESQREPLDGETIEEYFSEYAEALSKAAESLWSETAGSGRLEECAALAHSPARNER